LKFGLKLWSTNTDLIDQAVTLIDEKIFDYIELLVIPGTSCSPFKVDVPFVVHIPHFIHGVSIGDPSKTEYNLQKINESIIWADELGAQYLILHAGEGSLEHAVWFLNNVEEKRILIENMPMVGIDNEPMIGYDAAQIGELLHDSGMGFCLDLCHAMKAAISLTRDYKELIDEFLKLHPSLFHISDGDIKTEKDTHLDIGTGSFDFFYFKKCIENLDSQLITLETPRSNHFSLNDDLRNINILRTIWNLQKRKF
jgi:deoxyribonuclease-4